MPVSLETKKCFERKLAATIQTNPAAFPAVNKISDNILSLLSNKKNRAFILENNLFTDEVISELYSDTYYGTIGESLDHCLTQEQMLEEFINRLTERPVTDLPTVMHLHQLFSQKFYDRLPERLIKHNDIIRYTDRSQLTLSQRIAITLDNRPQDIDNLKKSVADKIFRNDYFMTRARIKTGERGQITQAVGIDEFDGCDVMHTTKTHENIFGVFSPLAGSRWFEEIKRLNQPFLGGPSGHTGSSMMLSVMIGNLNQEESKEYTTAVIGLLAGGGYHHAHEILVVAKKIGIPYEPDNHYSYLPVRFLALESTQQLIKEYPELFRQPEPTSVNNRNSLYSFFHNAVCSVADNVAESLLNGAALLNEKYGNQQRDKAINSHSLFAHTPPIAVSNQLTQIAPPVIPRLPG